MDEASKQKHFVLVHGTCHGSWCWYKLVPLLKSAGHRVTTLDLGGSGINPKRMEEVTSFSDYMQPLMEFMASLPQEEKVILVGHSYGGFGISLAMEGFPEKILVAVYVTAYMPNYISPPATLVQQFFMINKSTTKESLLDFHFSFDDGPENLPTSATFGPKTMATKLYQHCKQKDLELAKMLVKPSKFFLEDLTKESILTKEKFGSVNRVFIVCEKDELFKKELQRWFIENSPTKDVKTIAGADHMVMLSKPKELFLYFQEIVESYNSIS